MSAAHQPREPTAAASTSWCSGSLDAFVRRVAHEFRGSGEFIDSGRQPEYAAHALAAVPLTELDALAQLQLLVLKPESVASGKAIALWCRLQELGIRPVFQQLLQRTSDWAFEELYRYNFGARIKPGRDFVGNCWMLKQGFSLGAAMLVVVACPARPAGSVYATVNAIKGPSIPFLTRPGELRHDFVAVSRAFNLIHSSDDPISTFREWTLFTPLEQVRECLHRVAHAPGWAELDATRRMTDQFRLHGPTVTDASLGRALLRVAARMSDVAALVEPSLRPVAERALEHLGGGPPAMGPIPELRWAVGCLRDLGRRTSAAPGRSRGGLATALRRFLRFPAGGRLAFEEHVARFEAHGLRISEWDRAMILSNLHTHTDLASALEGGAAAG